MSKSLSNGISAAVFLAAGSRVGSASKPSSSLRFCAIANATKALAPSAAAELRVHLDRLFETRSDRRGQPLAVRRGAGSISKTRALGKRGCRRVGPGLWGASPAFRSWLWGSSQLQSRTNRWGQKDCLTSVSICDTVHYSTSEEFERNLDSIGKNSWEYAVPDSCLKSHQTCQISCKISVQDIRT